MRPSPRSAWLLALPLVLSCRNTYRDASNDSETSSSDDTQASGTQEAGDTDADSSASSTSDSGDGDVTDGEGGDGDSGDGDSSDGDSGDGDSGDGDGDGDSGDGDSGDGDGDSDSGDGDSGTGNQAPEILSFEATATTLSDGESVTFTAVVTDPDGAADLIGGNLSSADGSTFFGSFANVSAGTYVLTLSWDELDQIDPIVQEGQMTEFRAEFFDMSAASDDTLTSLIFTCESLTLCDGSCVNLDNDVDNCGGCGHACIDQAAGCSTGNCAPAIHECFEVVPPQGSSCGQICLSMGESCAEFACDGGTFVKASSELACIDGSGTPQNNYCNEPLFNFGAGWYGCCCTDTP